jgi:hypothetical protein
MLRNNGGEQYDDRGGAGHNGLPRDHSVRDRERGRENLRGVEEEEEEDVMSIILAGPYGEVRHYSKDTHSPPLVLLRAGASSPGWQRLPAWRTESNSSRPRTSSLTVIWKSLSGAVARARCRREYACNGAQMISFKVQGCVLCLSVVRLELKLSLDAFQKLTRIPRVSGLSMPQAVRCAES